LSKFQRHSIHRRRARRGNALYIVALVLMGMMVMWFLTMDVESNAAFQWMTGTTPQRATATSEVKIFEGGHFAVPIDDSIPIWIATDASYLPIDDTVIFGATQFGKTYELTITENQLPLWNDYVRHARHWTADCDTLYIIYGKIPKTQDIYTINLCISEYSLGQAILIPDIVSDKPFFEFTHAIDHVEQLTNIDFFKDLLDEESEVYIEKVHQRLKWLYPQEFYQQRLNEIKLLNNADNEREI
jgi:hypothetical protein